MTGSRHGEIIPARKVEITFVEWGLGFFPFIRIPKFHKTAAIRCRTDTGPMAQTMKSGHQAKSDALDSLVNILLPIARVLIQRDLGAGPLVLAAKAAYLRAAIEAVAPRGARPNVSRLSVVTGMTRKEVSLLLRSTASEAGLVTPKAALEQRTLRVVRGWTTDPLFRTRRGRPADLSLRGDGPDFETLVRAYGGDVTTASVLKELERTNAVTRNRQGKLRLRNLKSRLGARPSTHLSEFANLLNDFVATTSQVIQPNPAPLYFGFRDSLIDTAGQAALFQRTFARRAAVLLASVEQWQARQRDGVHKVSPRRRQSATRVGLGVYLVQNDPVAGAPSARERQ